MVISSHQLSCLFLVIFLLSTITTSLELASRCLSSFAPGECPCSRRSSPSLDFCLMSTDQPDECRQRTCSAHYVCDCNGDTLCRTVNVRSTLTCRTPVAGDGTCQCSRNILHQSGSRPTTLIALRPLKRVHSLEEYTSTKFCTEGPDYWSSETGVSLLRKNWHLIADASHPHSPFSSSDLSLLRFGHSGHAVSFTSPETVAHGLRIGVTRHGPLKGDLVDPRESDSMNRMASECISAAVSVEFAKRGLPTRPGVYTRPVQFSQRMVLQACPYLSKNNQAVGMSVENLLNRAMLATGEFPLDDTALSHEDVMQACVAIHRNFNACNVNVGCVAVTD